MQRAYSLGKNPDAGKGWGQEEKGAAEDEMVGWHHWLSEHEFEQTLADSVGETWRAAVHGVTRNWTWLRDWKENKGSDSEEEEKKWNHHLRSGDVAPSLSNCACK